LTGAFPAAKEAIALFATLTYVPPGLTTVPGKAKSTGGAVGSERVEELDDGAADAVEWVERCVEREVLWDMREGRSERTEAEPFWSADGGREEEVKEEEDGRGGT
jgi:hypothetical protein